MSTASSSSSSTNDSILNFCFYVCVCVYAFVRAVVACGDCYWVFHSSLFYYYVFFLSIYLLLLRRPPVRSIIIIVEKELGVSVVDVKLL